MSRQKQESSEIPSRRKEGTEIMPGYTSMDQFTKDGFKVLMEAIRHSNALPSGRDWSFYNVSESFTKIMTDEGNTVLHLMNQVMRGNDLDSNIRNRVLDEKVELVIEANDMILEKVANHIDEMNGIRRFATAPVEIQTVSAQLPINGSWNRAMTASGSVNSPVTQGAASRCVRLIAAKNIVRPQKFFKDKIDNSTNYPWCPRITDKPNSLKPLAIFLEEYEDRQEYSHPYEFELDRFAPTPEQLLEETPVKPKELSETPLIEIDKPEQLDELVETLRGCKVFGVDLEHHSYRSFMGITCLMQISTEDKDYLIDALALRDKLWILNEVFTKNTIVKVFHGSDNDIEWLQRDLSIYVVNMFDTHQAARMLQYSGLSLSFLMRRFCNILPNKEFQLADWRIRPLPEELKMYARQDTHYLIYIYQMLKKELLTKANKLDNLVRAVIERSTEICKQRYFKPVLTEHSHLDALRKCRKMFDNRQLYALKNIYSWRDNIARQEDESLPYVLPTHMMLQIAETLPREMQGILACCNPIPPLVRSNLLELHKIVLKAREQPLERVHLKTTSDRGVLKEIVKINVNSVLHCPHDQSKANEFRNDLPTLLNNYELKAETKNIANVNLSIEKSTSYSVFDDSLDSDSFNERETFKKVRGFNYFSPYQRYKLVNPYVVAEEEAAAEAVKEEAKSTEEEQVTVHVQEQVTVQELKQVQERTEEEQRTDEQRIASVRDHFMQLSKRFSEELQIQKEKEEEVERQRLEQERLLSEGSRKRKREENENGSFEFELPAADNNFLNPIPVVDYSPDRWSQKFKNKGRKRNFSEINGVNYDNREQQSIGTPKSKKKKKNNQKQQQQQNQQQQQQPQQQRNQQQQSTKNKRKFNNLRQPQHDQSGGGLRGSESVPTGPGQNQQKKRHRLNKWNQNKNFVPYDYASVDFRQFQGGAGSAGGAAQINSNAKAKNRKRNLKRGAKSATFNNNANRGGNQGRNY
jgi:exosome complex exonuclease RRP6